MLVTFWKNDESTFEETERKSSDRKKRGYGILLQGTRYIVNTKIIGKIKVLMYKSDCCIPKLES